MDYTIRASPFIPALICTAVGHRQPDLNKRRNVEQSYQRVARLGDGWMTTFKSPEDEHTSLAMIRGY